MFSYFRKGRSESKTFIEDKVKWFHFINGATSEHSYDYTASNIFNKYWYYRISYKEYIDSLNYFNELCECCSVDFNKKLKRTNITWIERVYNIIGTNSFAKSTNFYKKGKLFEILLILYITKGYAEIKDFPDFIEKWFRDGILILITDLGYEIKDKMKNTFFNNKFGCVYTCKSESSRYIFEIKRQTGTISVSICPSYYEYFELNKKIDGITKRLEDDTMLDVLKYSYDSKPIAKCKWVPRKEEGR